MAGGRGVGGGEDWRRDFWGEGHILYHDCSGGHVTGNIDHSPSNLYLKLVISLWVKTLSQ